jgi:hypothetical protein
MPFRASVEELLHSPHYQNVLAKIKSLAPIVPEYDYKGPTNIEEIKARLAERRMHDLVMAILNPKGKADG